MPQLSESRERMEKEFQTRQAYHDKLMSYMASKSGIMPWSDADTEALRVLKLDVQNLDRELEGRYCR